MALLNWHNDGIRYEKNLNLKRDECMDAGVSPKVPLKLLLDILMVAVLLRQCNQAAMKIGSLNDQFVSVDGEAMML